MYHSATPELGASYQQRVLAVWPDEKGNQLAAGQQKPGMRRPIEGLAPTPAWAATLPAAPSNRVAVMLPSNRSERVQIIPLNSGAPPGRGLDAYRAAPIAIASRPFRSRRLTFSTPIPDYEPQGRTLPL